MTKVAIIQKEIPHYRVSFFEEMSAQGSALGLDVTVYCASTDSPFKSAYRFSQRALPIHQITTNKSSIYWMKGLTAALAGADVIIAPQELRCVNLPYLWAIRRSLCKTWVWWGHGYNFQASVRPFAPTYIKEAIKRFLTKRSDGLITYTRGGADYWRKRGLPEDRVIPYYNTIDVEGLRKAEMDTTEQQRTELTRTLRLRGKHVLLFSGSLYAEKKVDFLLRAFDLLKKSYPNVALIIIGDGVERSKLEQLAAKLALPDVHFLGELVDSKDTSAYFSLADLMVIPALVGLAIVHGFAFGLPLMTTECDFHSPEIEYLTLKNGVMTAHSEDVYAAAIRSVLSSPAALSTMKAECLHTAQQLTLAASCNRFVRAIMKISKLTLAQDMNGSVLPDI